jgi:Concanavalin A-like lectin/glucanases superfamily
MYGRDNRESPPRANRIAFYAYNPAGGEGAGAYFQQPVVAGRWIYVVGELTPTGVRIYRDGVFEQGPPSPATLYADPAFNVTPRHGTAPVRVGTRNAGSFFAGAVDELAIYGTLLTPRQIRQHYRAGLASLRARG